MQDPARDAAERKQAMKTFLKVMAFAAVAAGIATALYFALRPRLEQEYIVLDNSED